MLPIGLGTEGIMRSIILIWKVVGKNKDFRESLFLRKDEQTEMLKEAIMDINSSVSKKMMFYHMLTVSPLKNASYAFAKFSKSFKSRSS
jgi:hypothetical protein